MRLTATRWPWQANHRLAKCCRTLIFLLSLTSCLPRAANCGVAVRTVVETAYFPLSAIPAQASSSSPSLLLLPPPPPLSSSLTSSSSSSSSLSSWSSPPAPSAPSAPPAALLPSRAKAPADGDNCAPCFCKWSGGKQTAECAGAQLAEVPRGLRTETQVMNLTGNALNDLKSREFHSKGYSSLQRIFVPHCNLSELAPDAFFLLTNLVELDLSFNHLQRVPSQALSDCVGLRRLSLNNNPIETVHNDAFRGLSRLATLELSHCQLHTVGTLAFRGLRGLEFLRMAHNRLRRLQSAALTDQLATQLYGVDLEENPWNCDCGLRSLRQWMSDNNIPLSAPPKCENPPRLLGTLWNALSIDDFACEPQLLSIDVSRTAIETGNATIRCEVHSEPASSTTISWSMNGRQIRNMSLMTFGRQLYVIHETESLSRLKTSALTIVNVLLKDAGTYVCVGSNRAGSIAGNVTLSVLPQEQFGPLTAVEIVGVTIGFGLTCLVLLGAVYLVMQQYAKYCEQRAASAADGEVARKPSKHYSSKSDVSTKPNYETVVAMSHRDSAVSVDLLDHSKSFADSSTSPSESCSKATPSTMPNVLDKVLIDAISAELKEQQITCRLLVSNLNLKNQKEQQCEAAEDVPPPAPKSAKEFSVAECQPSRNLPGLAQTSDSINSNLYR